MMSLVGLVASFVALIAPMWVRLRAGSPRAVWVAFAVAIDGVSLVLLAIANSGSSSMILDTGFLAWVAFIPATWLALSFALATLGVDRDLISQDRPVDTVPPFVPGSAVGSALITFCGSVFGMSDIPQGDYGYFFSLPLGRIAGFVVGGFISQFLARHSRVAAKQINLDR